MTLRVSYYRMLIGDTGSPPSYTDAQLEALATIPQPSNTAPVAVQVAGLAVFRRFPIPTPGAVADSWATMTAAEWAALGAGDWSTLTP
jgi:hypothetical protein